MTDRAGLHKLLAEAGRDKQRIGKILNEQGRAAHEEMQPRLQSMLANGLNSYSLYTFCSVEALVWAGYASKQPGYYEQLPSFLEGRATESQVDWKEFTGRHGTSALQNACRSYLEFRRGIPKYVVQGTATASELLGFQNSALVRAIDLSKRGWLPNFGTWLFCGPFKIWSILNPRIWNEPSLQDIYMPLGCHVGRGFKKLAELGAQDIVPSLLSERDAGLAEGGFSTLVIAHSFQSGLADRSGGNVLHINTGLHQLGGGDLCC